MATERGLNGASLFLQWVGGGAPLCELAGRRRPSSKPDAPLGPWVRDYDAAVFLCSEESRYVHGHTLNVDGGFRAAGLMFGPRKLVPEQ